MGALVFGWTPDGPAALGMGFVVSSGVYILHREGVLARLRFKGCQFSALGAMPRSKACGALSDPQPFHPDLPLPCRENDGGRPPAGPQADPVD